MKTLISLAMATLVLGLVFSHDLVAGMKETEKMLIKQGWVKLSAEELRELKNYTAVGETGWFVYVDPSGTQAVHRFAGGGINGGERNITADGQECIQFIKYDIRCKFIWKRGKVYLLVYPNGMRGREYTIKPGNPENLKL